ncbi:hypothetical protein NQ176_g6900 [Zarea fungicola]|uniref:Uncharacterized protein n=1 Tax=Zarea fungicola TaxID=93591 RepID=A0ACC1N1N2_9HYPO|nr:hypothetical protein NQ176_g6900 [Lecanicillium fungicola]
MDRPLTGESESVHGIATVVEKPDDDSDALGITTISSVESNASLTATIAVAPEPVVSPKPKSDGFQTEELVGNATAAPKMKPHTPVMQRIAAIEEEERKKKPMKQDELQKEKKEEDGGSTCSSNVTPKEASLAKFDEQK